jgi:3,4-dihydroxy 2-butanone 4-phosphate synthase/GTP cyclohydrolase II
MESDRLDELKLPPMVTNNEDPKETAYAVSVDYKHGTTTGISAADRAATFRALADYSCTASDFQRPGHVFPLRYKEGGVLTRAGHTEATIDLVRLAGLKPIGVLSEVVNDDGSIKRLSDLKIMAAEHNIVMTSVADLIAYRLEQQK